ncbi:helix-turn-helix domain-containing protein [Mycobacteroides abscessus]|nr:helix-turn-helix domain-containing protein [Mycobacteroides abscessus]MDM2427115.1 helix-turn-helix domain-containing protein [Mycobacteroides abscessus]MDM2432218.1 helix-turn-helix domain-containing protein [Mycobacteroides abscessus]MDM2436735.1 helix-turn-helix domain-containing protein [Mycobacteroides abscessus]MDM2438655.1 helix-turn-helix domain-containing protein [Mycobacteroides abscessus]
MATFDLLGRRWAIAVLWHLRGGPIGFRDLRRELSGISTGVLSTRLREFVEVSVATTDESGKYRLTPLGGELLYSLAPLHAWSHNWARQLGVESFPNADDFLT